MSKKISRILLSVLGIASLLGQNAKADINLGFRSGFPYPIGIHFGYAPALNQAGFGIRGSVESIFITRFVISGLYYLPLEKSDSNFYFGLGGGLSSHLVEAKDCEEKRCLPDSIPSLSPEFHILAGFNWQFLPKMSLFFELSEVFWLKDSKISTLIWPFISIGLNFCF